MSFESSYRLNKVMFVNGNRVLLALLSLFINDAALAASDRTPLVVVSTAQMETVIKQIPLTGTITSAKVARLSAEVNGQVEIVNVEIGDRIDSGDTLLQLDREIEQFTLQSLQAETELARAQLADAKRRYQNAERLRQQNNISANELRLLEAEVEIDGAALKRQQADERKQQARVDRHTLKAPFDGVISERTTEVGEWIEPGKPVLTLVAIDDLRIDFRVPQEFYTRINQQSAISVTLDALPNREFNGKIETVVPISDPSSRTFIMLVKMDDSETRMTPGMSVQGKLRLNTGRQGVVISRDALLRYPDGRVTVWVVKPEAQPPAVAEQRVKTGHSFDSQITILEGIQAGDVVVVKGNESLQEGQPVRIQGSE
ncbi:MAG: efflux RND transporter periplasmic adaptor subunit [Gammaproteobacteria bacterium]|nr:efflux RND transporter periplasmic adaptor subunit [Gammaproteobacteria bacterium]